MIQHLVSVEQLGLDCRIILFCIQIVFLPFCYLSFVLFDLLCLYLAVSAFPLYTLPHWLGSLFFFYSHLPSVRFINQCVAPLYGSWDQNRFTLGLNACSHGLLHLKGNSFSWNFAVQFETRLMLANFTPPLFQNVSSIALINWWWTKGMCQFVMVMSGGASQQKQHRERKEITQQQLKSRHGLYIPYVSYISCREEYI